MQTGSTGWSTTFGLHFVNLAFFGAKLQDPGRERRRDTVGGGLCLSMWRAYGVAGRRPSHTGSSIQGRVSDPTDMSPGASTRPRSIFILDKQGFLRRRILNFKKLVDGAIAGQNNGAASDQLKHDGTRYSLQFGVIPRGGGVGSAFQAYPVFHGGT